MSSKNGKFNDESIYDILYKPPPQKPKPPRYVSKYHDDNINMDKNETYMTMGVAKMVLNDPQHFLRKGTGVKRPSTEPQKRCLANTTLPKLPQKSKTDDYNKKTCDFIKSNVSSAKHLKPKTHDLYIVDSPRGHKSNVVESNLKFVYNKHFGTVPPYIIKRKNEIHDAEVKYQTELKNRKPLCTLISDEERQQLMDGLKQNWAQAQRSLVLLPLMIDTVVKINKKKKIEDTLKELEKSIKLLEDNPYIYVHN